MKLIHIPLIAISSCCLFAVCFMFFVRKPLTVGVRTEYLEKKLGYLESSPSPKLILLAGSNGRVSHRCETFEEILPIKCVNMSISADMSLDYQLAKIKPHLSANDIVYMPLEYGALRGGRSALMAGSELPYIMSYDQSHLSQMTFDRRLQALFYCDLKYLFAATGEMLLDRMGVKRRTGSAETLTEQGDESGHTLEKGAAYRDYLNDLSWSPPEIGDIEEESARAEIVSNFLRWAHQNGITVIGGLPTTFNDQSIPDDLLAALKNFFEARQQHFVSLQNKSQYSRDKFYDTQYHLSEQNQIQHSIAIADLLRPFVSEVKTENK